MPGISKLYIKYEFACVTKFAGNLHILSVKGNFLWQR